jgi:hypothetical protein
MLVQDSDLFSHNRILINSLHLFKSQVSLSNFQACGSPLEGTAATITNDN